MAGPVHQVHQGTGAAQRQEVGEQPEGGGRRDAADRRHAAQNDAPGQAAMLRVLQEEKSWLGLVAGARPAQGRRAQTHHRPEVKIKMHF